MVFKVCQGNIIEITLNSIQDGLQVTPGNVTTAKYMDITYLEDTPLQYLTGNDTIDVIEGDAESAQKFNEILQFASKGTYPVIFPFTFLNRYQKFYNR